MQPQRPLIARLSKKIRQLCHEAGGITVLSVLCLASVTLGSDPLTGDVLAGRGAPSVAAGGQRQAARVGLGRGAQVAEPVGVFDSPQDAGGVNVTIRRLVALRTR